MTTANHIKALLVDVGGVLLTNGWDHDSRLLASKTFGFDLEDMESRHRMTFDTYEIGKISLENYLNNVLFYKKRSFTQKQFQEFMFAQSKAIPGMIELIRALKSEYNLKVAVVSNEGRELTEHRIKKFQLNQFVDFFVSSCFVHLRKPDADIYHLALDLAQVPREQILYLDDRALFIQVAEGLGIPSLHHTDLESTRAKLVAAGLGEKMFAK